MAISFDSSSHLWGNTGTTHSYSHTCTGSNLGLYVTIYTNTNTPVVIGVTYNGVAMTSVGVTTIDTGLERDYMYFLYGPASGTNTITVTTSSSCTTYIDSCSYTGVKQAAIEASASQGPSGLVTTLSTSVTTITDNSWLFGMFRAGTAQTIISGIFRSGVNTTLINGDSNGSKTPPGSYSLGTTFSSAKGAQIVATITPYTTPSTNNSGFFMFF